MSGLEKNIFQQTILIKHASFNLQKKCEINHSLELEVPPSSSLDIALGLHSMARANLNKSEWLVTNTTAALKYIPKRPRICINWNPPFQTQIYLVKVPLNVSVVN